MNIICTHCKQEYPKETLKEVVDKETNETLYFCCNGCELAYSLLKECNLESFYQKLGDNVLQTKNMQDTKQIINVDSINFMQKYIKDNNGYKEVYFTIDGVVCAACVWLNEQILSRLNGVQEVKINYTTHKAKIIFDDKLISFKEIYNQIARIGYKAIVYDPKDKESKDVKRNRIYYVKLVVAVFCTMNIMWVNVGQYSGFFMGIDSVSSNILNLASFILATPVLFFCASDFYIRAYKGLKNGVIGMEMLVITGTTLVYCYSIYAWLSNSGHTYFESVCMIILFVLSAKFLESLSQKSANDNLDKLNAILPLEARLENGKIISVHDIKIGDKLLVLPGEMVACDGILYSEFGILDYSNISGESLSITKKINDELSAGSLVLEKPIIYKAQKAFEDSSISKLARLLNDSEFSTPPIATSAFKIAGKFSKIVLSIAFLSFCYYYFINSSGFEASLLIAVSVIVIACPCALALATPIASVVGLNVGFKNHIIYTKAKFLESLAKSSHVVFDKTGTLTKGDMKIVAIQKIHGFQSIDSNQSNCKQDSIMYINQANSNLESIVTQHDVDILKCILQHNTHKISNTIMQFLMNMDNTSLHDIPKHIDFELIAGKGFKTCINNMEFIGGSEAFMQEKNIIFDNSNMNDRDLYTHFYIACKDCIESKNDYKMAYIFYLQDYIKDNAIDLMLFLKKHNKQVIMLSGDRESVVKDVANKLNIDEYYFSQTPLQKADYIQNLIKDNKKVVMVGDGLNDSLALKYAQVGIAMGNGSEISLQHSDIIILDDNLQTLKKSFAIAHKTLKRIHENLIMSLIYNVLAIPLAIFGFVIPLFAAAFMSLSSICVVLNSLRLYKDRF